MNKILEAGRLPRTRLVRLYTYDKRYIENDGEPFTYVRTTTRRDKGKSYHLMETIAELERQMSIGNWIGCSHIPETAYRILPNLYMHISPCIRKLYNLTGIYKHREHDMYYIHNLILLYTDMPSRNEMAHALETVYNSNVSATAAEYWQIKDCLCDAWANVNIQAEKDWTLWTHLKEMKVKTFAASEESRSIEELIDNSEPGDTYTRLRHL